MGWSSVISISTIAAVRGRCSTPAGGLMLTSVFADADIVSAARSRGKTPIACVRGSHGNDRTMSL